MDSIECKSPLNSQLLGVDPTSQERKIFKRTYDFSKISTKKVAIRLEIILIDKWETGDELKINYGDFGNKVITSDEVQDHYDFFCGNIISRDRLVTEVFEFEHSSSQLEIKIEFIKGDFSKFLQMKKICNKFFFSRKWKQWPSWLGS